MCDISIIIPVYNGESYLEECLKSVLEQDIQEKEIICVDDGSEDMSVEIINRFMKKVDNITLLQQENRGAAVARNRALSVAKGKYIAFIDADDYYIDKTGLRRMVCECDKAGLMVCGSLRSILRKGEIVPANTHREEFAESDFPKIIRYEDFQYDYYYQSYIFRREFLKQNNIEFPNYRRYQDPPFMARAMWEAHEFMVLPIELYCYREREGGINYSHKQVNDMLRGIQQNLLFAKEKGLQILYINNRERLNKDFCYAINCSIEQGNQEALKILIDLSEVVEDEFFTLKSLEKVKNAIKRSKIFGDWEFRFPFQSVPYGSKIALYGAGNVGKTMYSIVTSTEYCNLTMWVDQNYQNCQKAGLPVEQPEMLSKCEADYILVAVEKEALFEEISEFIKKNDWGKGKIIVGPMERRISDSRRH